MKKLIFFAIFVGLASVSFAQQIDNLDDGSGGSLSSLDTLSGVNVISTPNYDETSGLEAVEVANMPQYHYTSQTLIDTTNASADTAYSQPAFGATFGHGSLHLYATDGVGVTFRVFTTNFPDATLPAFGSWPSGYWYDATEDLFGSTTVVLEDSSAVGWIDTNMDFERLVVQRDADNATNTIGAILIQTK